MYLFTRTSSSPLAIAMILQFNYTAMLLYGHCETDPWGTVARQHQKSWRTVGRLRAEEFYPWCTSPGDGSEKLYRVLFGAYVWLYFVCFIPLRMMHCMGRVSNVCITCFLKKEKKTWKITITSFRKVKNSWEKIPLLLEDQCVHTSLYISDLFWNEWRLWRWYLSLCYCTIVQTVYSSFKPLFGFAIFSFFFCSVWITSALLMSLLRCIEMPCTVSFPQNNKRRKKGRSWDVCVRYTHRASFLQRYVSTFSSVYRRAA